MQISKKQLKQIISEEMETVSEEKDQLDTLLEGYVAGYGVTNETVSKEALMDFLEVLEETQIPVSAFQAFVDNLPENISIPLLKEVVDNNSEE